MISIPFVGFLRSDVLEKNGFDLEKIKKSSPEDIAHLDGFSEKIAVRIKKYAELVDKEYEVPEETVFKEFRCPNCGAIVSEVEYECHRCGHMFFSPTENYEQNLERLAQVIVKIYRNPRDPNLWREGEKILEDMLLEGKASDFKFKASALELELLERESRKEVEKRVEAKPPMKRISLKDMYKKSLTNGLVNGMGAKHKKSEKPGLMRFLLPLLILIVPIVLVAVMTAAALPPIVIDGDFSDWKKINEVNVYSTFFKTIKLKIYDDTSYIYISAAENFFQNTTKTYLMILIDYDSLSSTGFPISYMGVDYILSIYGSKNHLNEYMAHYFDNTWVSEGKIDYALKGRQCEIRTLKMDNARILFYYNDGTEHYSSIITLKSGVSVEYRGGGVVRYGDTIEEITLWNSYRGDIKIHTLHLENYGNSSATIGIEYEDMEIGMDVHPGNNTIHLDKPIVINKPLTMRIIYLGNGNSYGTLKFRIHLGVPQIEYDRCAGAYIEEVPTIKKIDGIFADWNTPEKNRRSHIPADVDIKEYQISNEDSVKMYIDVYGMLMGLSPPQIGVSGNHTQGNATHNKTLPMDTIEIYIDSDERASTGYKIDSIGAEYRILLSGNLGEIKKVRAYMWVGKWVSASIPIKKASGYSAIEIGLGIRGNVYFRLVNWQGIEDQIETRIIMKNHISTNFSIKNSTQKLSNAKISYSRMHTKLIGKYNATEFKSIFGTDVQVTGSSYDESLPTITRTSDGTLWVTYEYSDTHIYYATSTDGGSTWSVWWLLYTRDFSKPVIISDSEDNVYIFVDNHTSNSYFTYFKHNSSGWWILSISSWSWWSNVYNISAASYTYNGEIYIYVAFEYAFSSSDFDVGYVKTPNGGLTWYEDHDSSTSIAYTSDWEGHPRVTFTTGSNPKLFVSYDYYNSSSGNWEVMVKNNTEINGTKWSGISFYWSGHDLRYPSIYGTGDIVYLVGEGLYDVGDNDIWLYNTTDNGVNWNWSSWVNSTSNDEQYPDVVAEGSNVYVFFLDSTTGYICEKGSNDYGQTWGNVNVVSDVPYGVSLYRTVGALYKNGALYVVWTDDRNGNYDIYFDKVPELNTYLIVIFAIATIVILRKYSPAKR